MCVSFTIPESSGTIQPKSEGFGGFGVQDLIAYYYYYCYYYYCYYYYYD